MTFSAMFENVMGSWQDACEKIELMSLELEQKRDSVLLFKREKQTYGWSIGHGTTLMIATEDDCIFW
jgi:hypothetical protein